MDIAWTTITKISDIIPAIESARISAYDKDLVDHILNDTNIKNLKCDGQFEYIGIDRGYDRGEIHIKIIYDAKWLNDDITYNVLVADITIDKAYNEGFVRNQCSIDSKCNSFQIRNYNNMIFNFVSKLFTEHASISVLIAPYCYQSFDNGVVMQTQYYVRGHVPSYDSLEKAINHCGFDLPQSKPEPAKIEIIIKEYYGIDKLEAEIVRLTELRLTETEQLKAKVAELTKRLESIRELTN